jgi:hypothetical protein
MPDPITGLWLASTTPVDTAGVEPGAVEPR